MIEWDILLYISAFASYTLSHCSAKSSVFSSHFLHFHFPAVLRDVRTVSCPSPPAMCMFFVCVNPGAQSDEFALVVVSIRDEYFARPTRLLSFWKEDPRIIGGETNIFFLFYDVNASLNLCFLIPSGDHMLHVMRDKIQSTNLLPHMQLSTSITKSNFVSHYCLTQTSSIVLAISHEKQLIWPHHLTTAKEASHQYSRHQSDIPRPAGLGL